MCLGIPGKIEELDDVFAVVRIGRVRRKVLNTVAAKKGDFVLVWQNSVVERLEEKAAKEMATILSGRIKKKSKRR
ncbi:MAG: HypC/HybG/HupF family hydrogenase formation chaperone [Candidatus Diapherotrites archaeon]|uniref:HypC/HybG/HupF family hydrogenase formation chaperone n=1 Tax=Candidatus Iainarchaeum sp. TaxID=3101447 RepID=A0A8T4L718_9ARCH|nr:HypC/HybG/HupF family hydrogenase formation chaperone [Candidatus Diapherotrites archaeon]